MASFCIPERIRSSNLFFSTPGNFFSLQRFALFFACLLFLDITTGSVLAQEGAFVESNGLIVIQAESADLVDDWVIESSDTGYTGPGYIRWDGPNYYGDQSHGVLAYRVLINDPGAYNVRFRISHLGAPAGDQWNDVWARMNDGEWVKVLHPAPRKDEGFTFHSPTEPSSGVFDQMRYELESGINTLYIAGRSSNIRMDRIHFYKDGVPDAQGLSHAESERVDGENPEDPPADEDPTDDSEEDQSEEDQTTSATVSGELKKWHPVTITLDGPEASEDGSTNPFLDYRFNVEFTQGSRSFLVPGYFAADGDAANSSVTSGNKWRAHFVPDSVGTWTYRISMKTGDNISVEADTSAGTATFHDGFTASFTIEDTDKAGRDHRAKGMLRYVGEHYLQFDNGEYFLKGGANSPENLLAYRDFDDTYSVHLIDYTKKYEAHINDWQDGDPSWQDGKGKGLIGALNYLSAENMNSVYFLTMNVNGDGQDVWPWTTHTERQRYDISKLDQWDIVFNHMDQNGLMLHVVLQETENERLLNNGALGIERKLYYREMVARFGYHHAITWNLGEENDENTDAQRKEFASYIRSLDPYNHPIVLHTFPDQYDEIYDPLLAYPDFEGPSLQLHEMGNTYDETLKWRNKSAEAGRPWIVSLDEFGPFQIGVTEDGPESNHEDVRKQALWANLMAGGAGVEWYFGYETYSHDLDTEDWRTRDKMWDYTRFALHFFQTYLPFHKMEPVDSSLTVPGTYILADTGNIYAVYSPEGNSIPVNLPFGDYSVEWYNPGTGEGLLTGNEPFVYGPGIQNLTPPAGDSLSDWAALIKHVDYAVERPAIMASTIALAFASIPSGETDQLPVTISNLGNASLLVDSLVISGPDADQFTFLNDTSDVNIFGSDSLHVMLAFNPDSLAIDTLSADLFIHSSDPHRSLLQIGLTGIATGVVEEDSTESPLNFLLIDADTNEEIGILNHGDALDLSALPPHLNVRADVQVLDSEAINHVYLTLNPVNVERKESFAPYALFGDVGGNYTPGTFIPGENTLTATVHSDEASNSESLVWLSITFDVEGFNADTQVSVSPGITEEPASNGIALGDGVNSEVSGNFKLEVNYPNPFNPSTTIPFFVAQTSQVKIAIYDMLGREIRILVDDTLPSGRQEVRFDASGLPSGTYFYKLDSQGISLTRKMLLVR